MSNHPSMYWQLSHLSTPLYTFHITITPLHKTFLIHFTPPWWLSHSLTTVTPPQADVHLKWHTCLYFSHLPENCHNSWQLSHLPTLPNTSPMIMTITPLHQLTFLFNTLHTSLMTVTLPQAKWYKLCPFTSPHDHHTSPPTDTPP